MTAFIASAILMGDPFPRLRDSAPPSEVEHSSTTVLYRNRAEGEGLSLNGLRAAKYAVRAASVVISLLIILVVAGPIVGAVSPQLIDPAEAGGDRGGPAVRAVSAAVLQLQLHHDRDARNHRPRVQQLASTWRGEPHPRAHSQRADPLPDPARERAPRRRFNPGCSTSRWTSPQA